jgi:hypothetical protein
VSKTTTFIVVQNLADQEWTTVTSRSARPEEEGEEITRDCTRGDRDQQADQHQPQFWGAGLIVTTTAMTTHPIAIANPKSPEAMATRSRRVRRTTIGPFDRTSWSVIDAQYVGCEPLLVHHSQAPDRLICSARPVRLGWPPWLAFAGLE